MPFLIQSMREQNQAIAKINAQLEEMGGKVEETKEIAQQVVSQSQAPPGFAPSAPFPDTTGGFAPQFPTEQPQFSMSTGGFNQAPAAPFPAPTQGFASGGGFAQPGGFQPQFPPF